MHCPAGRYCPQPGTSSPLKCVAGKYSDKAAAKCTLCDLGTYCPNEATTISEKAAQKCPAGTFCQTIISGATETDPETLLTVTISGIYGLAVYPNLRDHSCPAGYYCPEGTTIMQQCPVGTYNSLKGRKSFLDCIKIDAGQYVNVNASTAAVGYCDPGYYCPEGSITSK